ncbi:uncharacterized protein DC041_0002340 [Schistosoma bovis]|uniref:PLAT domain-containing protein n=2 Tax=Schistosoma TaxID=6181 RepID=A0A430QSG0_SCHBO|nr:uncharacterized protein DC041_0002340 [Schistosoma bovis]
MNPEDSMDDDYLESSKSRFSFHRTEDKKHKGTICCGHNTCHLDRYNLISSVKPFTARPYTLYKIVLTTADVPGAGTSAQIYITLKGEWGSSTRQRLKKERVPTRNSRFYLHPGSSNTFSVVSPDLGGLHSVFVEHDSMRKTDSWLLESVQVFHPLTKKRYMFMCNHWFSLYKEDGLIARELFGIRSAKTKYSIVTVTGDQEGSGTNSKVYITIYGRTGITPRIELSQENKSTGKDILCAPFGRGTSTKFIVKAPNVGAITNIRIKQDESGNEPHWFLERVVVTDMSYPQWTYYFHLSCWLSSKYGDGKSCRLIRGYREPTGTGIETEYKLTFYTSDQKDAGTTGEVYVKLYGEKDSSREIWVNSIQQTNRGQSTSYHFTRGSTVEVYLPPCPQLGEITKLKVGHNGAGSSPSWFLNRVIVDDLRMNRVFEFPCYAWITKPNETIIMCQKSIKKEEKEIIWQKIPFEIRLYTGDVPNAGTTARVCLQLSGPEQITNSKPPYSNYQVANTTVQKGFDMKLDHIDQKTTFENKEDVYTTPYIWLEDVKTSPIANNYVTAAVSVIIFGSKDKTTKIHLNRSNLEVSSEWSKVPRNEMVEMFKPNVESKFRIYIKDIGIPCKLRVAHDNKGSNPNWHLQEILLTNLRTHEQFEFYCNRWLSTREDDGSILREIPAKGPGITNPLPLYHYILQIFTGNKPNSGTNANIFINIFGEKGDCGERWLGHSVNRNSELFQQNQMDEFVIEAVQLGSISKICIGHEERSPGYAIAYNVTVLTGSCRNAGTVANVFVHLYGLQGESKDMQLKHKETEITKFEAGKSEEFILACGKLGEIKKIKIWHDSIAPHSGWFLDEVVVIDYFLGRRYVFHVNRWLAKNEADGLISLELQPTSIINIERMIPYEIIIFTGDRSGSQTKSIVTVQLYGTPLKRKTEIIRLSRTQRHFKFGQPEAFRIFAPDIGPLQKLIVERDGTGLSDGWFLEKVLIRKPSNFFQKMNRSPTVSPVRSVTSQVSKDKTDHQINRMIPQKGSNQLNVPQTDKNLDGPPSIISVPEEIKDAEGAENYWFFFSAWLSKQYDNKQMNCEKFSSTENGKPLQSLMESSYEVIVKTGDRKYAGTDSHVYLTLFGINSESKEYHLANSKTHSNKFEQNHEDIFNLNAIGLGSLKKVRVRHTNTGIAPGWFLDYILIRESIQQKKLEYFFPCYQWLSATELDGLVIRELPVASENIFERWKSGHDIFDDSRLILEDQSTIYHVRIHTGSQSNISSDANVQIQLYGDKDFTGNVRLYKAYYGKEDILVNKFQAGQIADFIVKAINIGNIKKIRIEHDTAGGSSSWFIERVEVEAKKLGLLWKFECNRYITPQQPELILYPEPKDISFVKPMTNYQIKTFTSDISGAETTSSVYIQLYGNDGLPSSIRRLHQNNDSEHRFQRNKINTFYVELEELQEPFSKLRIWHNDKGSSTDWHLNKVEIRKIKTQQYVFVTYIFPCNKWLSRNMDQAALERELIPSHMLQDQNGILQFERQISPKWLMNTYEVRIITGDKVYAGTDASVYITLFGENGDSGERKLTKSLTHRNKFERGQTDVFQLEIVDLGKINKVRIRHDNSGVNPSWYLSIIEVFNISKSQSVHGLKDQPNETHHLVKYIFNCEAWLSTEHDEKVVDRYFSAEIIKPQDTPSIVPKISKDVVPHKSIQDLSQEKRTLETIPYLITVITGSDRKAGTPGPVWICCVDKNKMNSEKFILCDCYNRTKLKRGTTRYFRFTGAKINDLTEIQGKNKHWNLSCVEVTVANTNQLYRFVYNDWLSLTYETCLDIFVKTGNMPASSTDANVYVQLFGEYGDSGEILLKQTVSNQKPFQNNSIDHFKIPSILKLGNLARCRIWHDNKGSSPNWYCEWLEVKEVLIPGEKNLSCNWKFAFNKWLSISDDNKQLLRDAPCSEVYLNDSKVYEVVIETGNLKDSGTTCDAWIIVEGKHGRSPKLELVNQVSNPILQVNQTNTFQLQLPLTFILVYEVVIETGNLKDSGTTCDAWIIVEGKHGRSPKLELVNQVSNPILQVNQTNTFQLPSFPLGDLETIRLGIQERNIDKQINPNDVQSQKWFCEKVNITDPVSKRTYIFTIHQWLSVTPTSNLKKDVLVNYSKIIEDPYRKAFNELKNKQTIMYKVSIYTGTKGCANTDANIFITMFSTTPGLNSGRIALKRENKNLFDRKQLDEFYVESIDLVSESPNGSFIIIFEHFSYCLYGLWACINCKFVSVDKVDDNKTKSHINLFLLNEISFGYILVCRKMKKDNKRSYHGYGGYCHDCIFICRVFTNDMKRPESFQPRKRGPQHPDEALKEKLRRNSVPRGIYDNPYNPGLWRRTTTLTAPYTS